MQEVEQFPWQVTKTLRAVVDKLPSMSNNLHIDDEQVQGSVYLQNLASNLDDLKGGIFLNMAVGSAPERRQCRIRDYLGHQNDFTTIKNRLSSLASAQSRTTQKRTLDNHDCPFPPILETLYKCLDLQLLLDEQEFGFHG